MSENNFNSDSDDEDERINENHNSNPNNSTWNIRDIEKVKKPYS